MRAEFPLILFIAAMPEASAYVNPGLMPEGSNWQAIAPGLLPSFQVMSAPGIGLPAASFARTTSGA